MKLFTSLIFSLLFSVALAAQNQRLVLLEEFTGETCGPCAVNNPGMNAILDGLAGTVISLKYQNNIPSAGPNLYAYNTADVANRTTYYSNTASPTAYLEGNVWKGNASAVTAARILDRANVKSPFRVEVSHTFSPNRDTIYTKTVVTSDQAITGANYKLRIAVSERNVYGYRAPNGETEFSHVMRKLLPNGNGTSLPADWTVGQSVTVEEAWAIRVSTTSTVSTPLWPLLEVISWVQNDANKEVLQTGHSQAVLTIDAAIEEIDVDVISCETSQTPTIEVKNIEKDVINAMSFEYKIDNGTPVTYDWTGTLEPGTTVDIDLPSIALTAGAHRISTKLKTINGAADLIPTNNTLATTYGQPNPVTTLTQNFAATTFPPPNWLNYNPENDFGWTRNATAGFNGPGSAKMDFYNSPEGAVDILYPLGELNFATNVSSAYLRFDYAHRRYDETTSDQLEIEASTDCGDTWTTIWSKSGLGLATNTTTITSSYTAAAGDWKGDTINLSSFIGEDEVIFRFVATSGYGNNLYLDNIDVVSSTVAVDDIISDSKLEVYPNPANQAITVDFTTIKGAEVGFRVTDALGQVVRIISPALMPLGNQKMVLPIGELADGLYFVTLLTQEGQLTNSFVVRH